MSDAEPRPSRTRARPDEVAAAQERAHRGGDPTRWPDKLPVRDRLAVLVDPGSFVEDGLLATASDVGLPADGVITGVGTGGGPAGGRHRP